MGKFIALITTVCLFGLSLGAHYAPNDPTFWLVSGSPLYMALRLVLALVIIAQLVTKPPRKLWFRLLAGSLALTVAVWTVMETYNYQMMATDTLLFMMASISVGLTALEGKGLFGPATAITTA